MGSFIPESTCGSLLEWSPFTRLVHVLGRVTLTLSILTASPDCLDCRAPTSLTMFSWNVSGFRFRRTGLGLDMLQCAALVAGVVDLDRLLVARPQELVF